jgi:hypothetical protein
MAITFCLAFGTFVALWLALLYARGLLRTPPDLAWHGFALTIACIAVLGRLMAPTAGAVLSISFGYLLIISFTGVIATRHRTPYYLGIGASLNLLCGLLWGIGYTAIVLQLLLLVTALAQINRKAGDGALHPLGQGGKNEQI